MYSLGAATGQMHDLLVTLGGVPTHSRNMLTSPSTTKQGDHTVVGTYGKDPVSEAFIRSHDEPGRAWNMQEWMRRHRDR
ncbi:hypothetical protein AN477_18695 [Alicyclobacillus ferrooxydans]|uniref:Uncharacterized protein n=1 Tax=Alicyclobacillus ferrooxydans TaxID=471514 RepID=A0A0P9CZ75_9BACL|nr:hypothetical protein AN477_18695 [Alicyclobacillus ferrooxydans]